MKFQNKRNFFFKKNHQTNLRLFGDFKKMSIKNYLIINLPEAIA
jgi:hypothetical protein